MALLAFGLLVLTTVCYSTHNDAAALSAASTQADPKRSALIQIFMRDARSYTIPLDVARLNKEINLR